MSENGNEKSKGNEKPPASNRPKGVIINENFSKKIKKEESSDKDKSDD